MIGLIFGETNFPKEILKKIKKIKKKYLIIDLTKNKTFYQLSFPQFYADSEFQTKYPRT